VRSGELAKRVGLSPDTLRYYERKGILPEPLRSANGYRAYGEDHLKRLLVIQRALAFGFSVDELVEIFSIRSRGGAPCQRVRNIARQKIKQIETRLRELNVLLKDMHSLVSEWDKKLKASGGGRAHLLESIPASFKTKKRQHLIQPRFLRDEV